METSCTECSSPAGASRWLTQQEVPAGTVLSRELCKQKLEGFNFMVQSSLRADGKSPGGRDHPVPPVCVFVGPCSTGSRAQRDHPGTENRTFLCNDLTKGSAISFDSSCGSLVFQPMCSLGDVDNIMCFISNNSQRRS